MNPGHQLIVNGKELAFALALLFHLEAGEINVVLGLGRDIASERRGVDRVGEIPTEVKVKR